MKRMICLLLSVGILAACTPLNLYYREGAPVDRLNRDEADCVLDALGVLPVDNRTRYIPGTKKPTPYCDASGVCRTIWVQITPDRIETYDANEGSRYNYTQSCMAAKGYQRVRLPACSNDVAERTAPAATRILPPLTEKSCAIRYQSGQWQIVTP